jgi:hypothetical protein
MISTLCEIVGFLCLVAFAFLCWPPAALAVVGVGLLVGAQGFGAQRRTDGH